MGYGWSCLALPRALVLQLWHRQPRLDKFFAVRLCEFSSTPVRSGRPRCYKHPFVARLGMLVGRRPGGKRPPRVLGTPRNRATIAPAAPANPYGAPMPCTAGSSISLSYPPNLTPSLLIHTLVVSDKTQQLLHF